MRIKAKMFKTVMTLMTGLFLVSCSGHSSGDGDPSTTDELSATTEAVPTDSTAANTDPAPVSELSTTPSDPGTLATEPSLPSDPAASQTMATAPAPSDKLDLSEEPAPAKIKDSFEENLSDASDSTTDEVAEYHAPRKTHHKKKAKVSHETPDLAEARMEVAAAQPAEVLPAQQAQMTDQSNAVAAAATPVAVMPTTTPIAVATPMATIVPVQAAVADTADSKSNDYVKYGAIGGIVLLAGYLVYRRRRS